MKPQLSYTTWFSQRTGSTLLCKALESIDKAGKPREWFNTPLNIIYEDFIQNYEDTIHTILNYLELDSRSVTITRPALTKVTDGISEEWAQRFREERQDGWTNRDW